jgi:hypothetical protein
MGNYCGCCTDVFNHSVLDNRFKQKVEHIFNPKLIIKMVLSITDTARNFTLDPQDSIALELKLNVTEYGHPWKHIGDHLYNFGVGRQVSESLIVDVVQFDFLEMLMSKPGWEACRGLK